MTDTHKNLKELNAEVISHIRHALSLPYPQLNEALSPRDKQDVVIVDQGASVLQYLDEIKWQKKRGRPIWALGQAFQWLVSHGVEPDQHILLDTKVDNASFVPEATAATLLYASQCHPDVFAKASQGKNSVVIWHAKTEGMGDVLEGLPTALVGFGSTLALKALGLAYILGFRNFYLFGYDSSYLPKMRFAFGDSEASQEPVITVRMDDKTFNTSSFLASQAKEFSEIMPFLMEKGCQFFVQSKGLLPAIAKEIMDIANPENAIQSDMIQIKGTWWPRHDKMCRPYMETTFGDIHEIMKLCGERKTVLQAGGNVGIWPIEFSKYFAHVVTFEPDPLNYACLVRNTQRYPNIDTLNFGLSDKSETAGLAREERNCGAHFIQGEGDISLIKIDDMHLQSCDLIQLDIEGYEYKALLGGIETIKRFKPVIVVEEKKLGERYGINDDAIIKLLSSLNYKRAQNLHRDIVYIVDKTQKNTALNVCCLKWGKKYSADYVNRLAAMVRRNLKQSHRFVCLTDDATGIHPSIECYPLLDQGLEGWWHKMSFFRPEIYDLKGTLLFLDLDLVLVGKLDPFFDHPGSFCMIEDWLSKGKPLFNSSVFRLEIGSMAAIYEQFQKQDITSLMKQYPGDQEWLSAHVQNVTTWPLSWCVSFKWQCALPQPHHPVLPEDAKIVVFHGKPDPHEAINHAYRIYGPSQIVGQKMIEGSPAPWIASFWNVEGLV